MITAQELRIGNFILALGWDENSNGDIVGDPEGNEIEKVTSDLIKLIDGEHKCITQYEGIPLTPEILEKCFGEGFYDGNNELHFSCKFNDFGDTIYIRSTDLKISNDDMDLKHIKHLHQLQNLYFALTGEELEVKL